MVPVLDLSRRNARHHDAFLAAADRVLASGIVLLGPELARFEAAFADYTGYRHAIAVSSGSTALQLSLAALGVGPGDEVIVPAHTAVPTAAAVCATGAVPVLVDVDRDTATIDVDACRKAVTESTKAIMPVHLYGRPSQLPDLGLPIVEDAAQAHGALHHTALTATACYSFYPTKNLGGIGDGGAIVTDDDEIAAHIRRLRVHGMTPERMYFHVEISMNFRMSELEAAWLSLLLPSLDASNARRREVARAYRAAAPQLRWQADHPQHVHHLAVFRTDRRDGVRSELQARDIATAVHYPLAVTQQPAYAKFARDRCPEAMLWAAECVTVPCFPEISDEEVDLVCKALSELEA
ncbi:MAG: DegT/DnrJ/EryC1/StrS family aminotransferase [Acidimicrobiia bacterium]